MWKTNPFDFPGLNRQMARLAQKKAALDSFRPLSGPAVQRLRENMALEWTYHSNSIEGNTLTLQETRVVIEDGMTVRGKSMREHFEALNHNEAIGFVEGLAKPDYKLTARDVLDVHALVVQNIEKEFAGRYRNAGVRIAGANFVPPNVLKIDVLMDELISWANDETEELQAVVKATVFHHRFVWIHPFFDGNGRTARLLTNLLLMKYGYPPAIILKNDRLKYYTALKRANQGNYDKLLLLLMQAVERSVDIYLTTLNNNYDDYQPISDLVTEHNLPYGQEYLSLLARQGKIDAFKEGRSWLTTKKAVAEYVEKRERKR
jgi:Fic family protein